MFEKDRRWVVLALAVLLLLSACGKKGAGLQDNRTPPDKILFENGMKFLDKSQFIKARIAFQTLISAYPDSDLSAKAYLAVGDSYYKEGGTANLLQAEAQYKDFQIFYPKHEDTDDAQFKVVALNIRLMRPSDRDPTYARKAEAELKRFFANYPDSPLVTVARGALRDVEEILADGIQGKAQFYREKGERSLPAAESRFKELITKYPRFSATDETLFWLADTLEKQGRVQESVAYFAKIVSDYPFSRHAEEARKRLIDLEHPVPAVNEKAAAENEQYRIEKDFSIWNPFRNLWDTFSGGPDPYEEAIKSVGGKAENGNAQDDKDQKESKKKKPKTNGQTDPRKPSSDRQTPL